jgi:hypothetical protein
MQQQQLLMRVIEVLDDAGIPYMVTGSFVSSMQGDPRSTHDIDIVVALEPASIPPLLSAFPAPEFYLDEVSVRQAVARKDMVNLLHPDSGEKVDFWILTDSKFDASRFGRRITSKFEGTPIKVSRAEDTILMKLKWSEDSGGSKKQFTDAMRVYEVQYNKLDQQYLDDWATQLGIEAQLQQLRQQAKPL